MLSGAIRQFTTALTLQPMGKSSVKFHIDMRAIPSNIGHATSRGMRAYNEDRVCIGLLDVRHGEEGVGLFAQNRASSVCPPVDRLVFGFGVYDGHGGVECSQYVKEQLFDEIEQVSLERDTMAKMKEFWVGNIGGYWKRWSRRLPRVLSSGCFNGVDLSSSDDLFDTLKQFQVSEWDMFRLRVWLAHLKTDEGFLEYESEANSKLEGLSKIRSGSTATSTFIYPLEWPEGSSNRHFYEQGVVSRVLVSHIGDTHAILCDKEGIAWPLTRDHHPSNPIEAERLRKYGRGLIMTDSFGEERYLNFANTRSFGDLSGKDKGVSAEPEFTEVVVGTSIEVEEYWEKNGEELKRNGVKSFGGDEGFIVLVSDGVTNHLSDQEIVDLVTSTYNNLGVSNGTPQRASEEIVGFVECINGDDNATCVVIRLSGWGKWPLVDRTGSLREDKMGSTKLY